MRFLFPAVLLSILLWSCKNDPKSTKDAEPVTQAQPVNPLDSISKLIAENPNDANLYHARGVMLLLIGEIQAAMGDVGRAIIMDSSRYEYYLTISDVYFRANKPKLSQSSLKKARGLAPENTEPVLRLAEFNLYLQDYRSVLIACNDAIDLDPNEDRAYFFKALAYKELGDTAKAIDNYLLAVEKEPDNVDAYVELGIIYSDRNIPLAEQYYKNALRSDPNSREAMYGLGLYYQDNDRLNEALEIYTQLTRLDSNYVNAYYNMGFINYEMLKDYNLALDNFNRAVRANPDHVSSIYMRGLCFEARGDIQNAKGQYQLALRKDQGYKLALDALNRVLN
jgi:tetratricopeptide (TPR) repeat protein